MPLVTPTHRLLSVVTPLGADAVLLTAFSGREEIGRGFRYELEMLSDRDAADVRGLVGREISWCVRMPTGEPRWFHGVVSRLVAGGRNVRDLRTYRVVVVPPLCYRGATSRCRIFEKQTVPQVVDAVFDAVGHTDHTWVLTGTHTSRPLCVQYRESDWDFVCRLLEAEGIAFFFHHEEGRCTLVLADDSLTTEAGAGRDMAFCPTVPGHDRVSSWERQYDGSEEIITGSSHCCSFTPGETFTLTGHDCVGEDGTYLLVAVEHAARDSSLTPHGGGREYVNSFTCVPASTPFRPARVCPRPTVRGPQSAVVVDSEEKGRIRVRFPADGPYFWEQDASCWANLIGEADVAPPVGSTVLVDFLDADPERPVIGSAMSSRRPRDAGLCDELGNELRFVKEEVMLRASQDCWRVVANDDAVSVGRDQTVEVKNHRTQTIREGNDTVRLEKGHRLVTLNEGDETTRLEKGNRTLIVGGEDHRVVRNGNRNVQVEKGDDSLQVDQGKRVVQLEMGDDVLTLKAGNQTTRLELGRSSTEALKGIELRVGPSRIALEPTGIVIEGLSVRVHGHACAEVHGLMTQVGADAVLEVKGAATLAG